MDPSTGLTLMAGLGAASGMMNSAAQGQTNAMNQNLMQQEMNFDEQMSSTAHQREVRDLEAAGLNPILSAGGSGAATPPSPTATMQSTQPGQALAGIGAGLSQALDMQSKSKNLDLTDSQIDNVDSDTNKKDTESGLNTAQTSVAKTQAALNNQQKSESQARASLTAQQEQKTIDERILLGENLNAQQMKNKFTSQTMPAAIQHLQTEGRWAEADKWLNVINSISGSASKVRSTMEPLP